jgi:polysaccharide biosynthesis/export protein
MQLLRKICFILLSGSCFVSCISVKKQTQDALYFKDISDSLLQKQANDFEPIIQKGDILSIAVITPNEQSARLFNQPGSSNMSSGTDGTSSNITFPLLGNIKAAGLTRLKLSDTLSGLLRKYIDSAIVSIRVQNYRITVLGEVAKPGTYSIPSERVSVIDAIGLAGDLTIYGRRNKIRVIRNMEGKRETGLLDLNKGDIFDSPFFYLRQNDIVYIEMNDRKIPNTDQASLRNVSIGLGIISALGVIISTINVLK